MTSEEVNDFIKKNHKKLSDMEIGNALQLSVNAIEHRRRNLGIFREKKYGDIKENIESDITSFRKEKEDRSISTKYRKLLGKIEDIEMERDAAIEVSRRIETYTIHPTKGIESEAVAVVLASDWHVEEEVKGKKVNFKNTYNLDVAQKRSEEFFINTVKLLKNSKRDIPINTLVLALLGDFISGNIHDELLENCMLRPIEAIIFAQKLIASGIEYLLKNTEVEIIVPCHVGNHGRITKKIHISTEEGNSLEYYMYHVLANHFENERRIKFIISESYHSYLKVFDYTIRFHHGHSIKYGGGIGGLTVPTYRIIGRWNKTQQADLDCFGHHHTQFDGNSFIANGSQIGYSPYGLSVGGTFDRPKQTFFLIDRLRGKTTVTPIWYSK